MHAFARLATPKFPIMDNMYLESFFFAVPCRLLWDKWERFNGHQPNPGDSTDFTIPELVEEKSDLDERILKLKLYLSKGDNGSGDSHESDDDENDLMWRQLVYMESYANILGKRIRLYIPMDE